MSGFKKGTCGTLLCDGAMRARSHTTTKDMTSKNDSGIYKLTGTADEQALTLARRRGAPMFFLADSWGELLVSSFHIDRQILERSRHRLDELIANGELLNEAVLEHLDQQTLVRFVPLPRDKSRYFAVFVEPVKRDTLAAAIRRFGVSKREAEVLQALMAGLASPAIADRLSISESTVGEHIKNLFKKTKTNKRSELVAKVFHDLAEPGSPL